VVQALPSRHPGRDRKIRPRFVISQFPYPILFQAFDTALAAHL
jgi:hypothetical protein